MAELVLTDEEKAAETYLEWDDAALGKCVKALALSLKGRAENEVIYLSMAGMVLVGMAYDTNADTMAIGLEGCTRKGEPMGDWEVVARRKGGV